MAIDPLILDAYLEYSGEQARAGILECARWEAAMLSGATLEEYMVETLRAAGRLPEGWDAPAK